MAKYGVVAGDTATRVMKEMIEDFDDMEVTYSPSTLEEVIEDMTSTGGIHLHELRALLVVDYAFNFGSHGDLDKVAEEFVAVQDLLKSNRMKLTLYLITRNTDLYDKLQGSVSGVPGIHYENVQVLLTKEEYKAALIRAVLLGEQDGMGLYNKDARSKKTRKEILEEEQERELESRRNLKDELLKFDSIEPVMDVTEMDYIDSTQRKAHEAEKQRELESKKRQKKRSKVEDVEEEPKGEAVEVNIYTDVGRSQEGIVRGEEEVKGSKEGLDSGGVDSLRELFTKIRRVGTMVEGKIEADKGIISVVGDYGAGASGVVANMAEMYTMSKKKVLVVDLDIQNRMQTTYFSQYEDVVRNKRGVSSSLIEVVQGYGIEENVVPITTMLHVLSVGKNEEVSLNWITAIAGNIRTILLEAKQTYDIIILDIPFRLFERYLEVFEYVDVNIFIVENKFYKLGNFLENILHPLLLEYKEVMEEIITKSDVVINKYVRGLRDYEGYEINRYYIRNALDGIGYPYDNMGVIGEIPYYADWENQFLTGVRYVWQDNVALGVYRRVLGRVVV